MGEIFANPLMELAEYVDMKQALERGKGPVQASGVTDSQKVGGDSLEVSCNLRRYEGQGNL